MPRRVLLIGATGTFGSRLAGLLSAIPGLELVLAARTAPSLAALRQRLVAAGARAPVTIRVVDRQRAGDLGAPWLVIDAAGPFQGQHYSLALAAVRAGAHYVDISDARDFVAGFEAAVGAAAGVLAVTGASSTPALSHAALARLVGGWTRLDDMSWPERSRQQVPGPGSISSTSMPS